MCIYYFLDKTAGLDVTIIGKVPNHYNNDDNNNNNYYYYLLFIIWEIVIYDHCQFFRIYATVVSVISCSILISNISLNYIHIFKVKQTYFYPKIFNIIIFFFFYH